MTDHDTRLVKCFNAVFDGLSEDQIRNATTTNVEGWDSVATVTLITLVEEEFGVEMDLDDLERFTSFDSMLSYVRDAQLT